MVYAAISRHSASRNAIQGCASVNKQLYNVSISVFAGDVQGPATGLCIAINFSVTVGIASGNSYSLRSNVYISSKLKQQAYLGSCLFGADASNQWCHSIVRL